MNTEPKLGTCDKTPNHLISVGCPYLDSPHTHNKFCIHWREGESAAVQLCGEYVTHVIAGASWINCALPKGHKMKGHRGKGTCVKHGEYFGEVGAFPQCPKWPDCIVEDVPDEKSLFVTSADDAVKALREREAVPPAAETAITRFAEFNDPDHPFSIWWNKHGQYMMSGGGIKEFIWAARGWIAREQLLCGVEVTGDSLHERRQP